MSIRDPDSLLAQHVAEPEELSRLVERIVASRHFRRSHRLSSFLEFICSETLAGNSEKICEQLIGFRVFGRAENYDPTSDNIVRVEASQLRKRLEAYFSNEGSAESLVIRVPKGGYVPVFEPSSGVQPKAPSDDVIPPQVDGPPADSPSSHRPYWIAGIVALALIGAGFGVYRLRHTPPAESQTARVNLPPRFAAFWAGMFEERRPTLLCLADSNLSLLQDLRRESISFTDYTSGRYLSSIKNNQQDKESDRILSEIASRYYTSLGDAFALARFMLLNRNHGPVVVRFARDLNIRDLRSGNAILLGSARSNPWIELLDRKRRFHIEHDIKLNRPILRDTRPEPGKPSVYVCGPQGEKPYEAYGIVASVPNVDGAGHAVLVAGSNMQGTEAASEFLTNAATFDEFLGKIGWHADKPMPVFEVVLKLVTIGGSSISTQVFAYDVENQ